MRWFTLFSLAGLIASAGCGRGPEIVRSESDDPSKHRLPIVVEDSGSTEVDLLVKKLVSARPAPYPGGYWPVPIEFTMMYATPQVEEAMALLKKKGPPIFPKLVHHLHDDRYCYSASFQAVDNHSVGDAVMDILCDNEPWGPVYMAARNSPHGRFNFLTFGEYIREKGQEQWAQWATNKTRLEIQSDFIDWCVATEEQRGFVDADQKVKLLARYESARERIKRKYSEPSGAANGSQPIRSETNRTSSATSPRR